ncbi:hypothetical protein BGZ58_002794 [Dissophora ornata]|nr:hypothetical protein BGZ58_002794 [Dissophora ornata]
MDQSGHIAPVKLLSARVSNQIRQQQQQREAHDPSMVTATTVTTPASAAANSDSADSYELDTVTIVPLPRYERLPQASAQYTAGPEAESPRPPAIFKDRQLRRTGHRGSTDQPQIPITVVHLSSVSSVSEPGSRAVSELRIGISTVVPSADHVNPVRLLSARVSDRIRQQQQHHQEEEEDGPRDFEEYVLEDIDALPAYERPSSPLTAQEHPVTELRFQVEGLSETIDAPPEYSPREEEDPAAPPSTVSIPMPADAESEPQPSPPNSDTTCPLAGSATS